MARIAWIHRNAAEAEERAGELRRAGHQVRCCSDPSGADLRALPADPPDAIVIDLSRSPSFGRDAAIWLRRQKATRGVPLIFVEGEPEKTRRVRNALPDAACTGWSQLPKAVEEALAHPPAEPIVPGIMDAYAGTPLPRKLGIRAGAVLALLGAPPGFEANLGTLPDGVHLRRRALGPADVIVLFTTSRADLERRFPAAARALAEGGKLWIAWPKKASGVASDLSQGRVRSFGLDAGFVDYKIGALDSTWSGLCFARRRR